MLLYVFGTKIIFSKFRFWDTILLCSVVHETNVANMICYIPSILKAYSLGKLGLNIQNCQFEIKFGAVTNFNR